MKRTAFITLVFILVSTIFSYGQNNDTQKGDDRVNQAVKLLSVGMEDEALKVINGFIEDNPDLADGYVTRALVYSGKGNFNEALNDISKAFSYRGKHRGETKEYLIYAMRSRIYEQAGRYDEALNDIDKAYELVPKDDMVEIHDILHVKSMLYMYQNEFQKADEVFELMLESNPEDIVALLGLASNRVEYKDYRSAMEITERCEKIDPSYKEIYALRCVACYGLGEYYRAIDHAIMYCEQGGSPFEEEIMGALEKHLDYAIAKVKTKLDINDRDNYLGWKLLEATLDEKSDDYISAIKIYDELESMYGPSSFNYYYRSKCYYETGDWDMALSDINHCISLEAEENEDSYNSLIVRADIYRATGLTDKAIEDYKTLLKQYPADGFLYCKLAVCYKMKGDTELAIKNFSTGIEMNKGDQSSFVYFLRGMLLRETGETQKANADFEKVIQMDTIPSPLSRRQFALHFQGEDEKAMQWADDIVKNNPDDYDVCYDYARLMSLMKKTDEAVNYLRKAFEKGFRAFDSVESDSDFEPIRNTPEFRSLVGEFKGKAR